MEALGVILAFIANHLDVLDALYKAITAGASKASVIELLKKAEVEASDAVMKEELGLPLG